MTDKEKAKQFAKEYKMIDKKPQDRETKRENRRYLQSKPTEWTVYEKEITIEELERTIRATSSNKAAGEDEIPYDVIHHLGTKTKQFILDMYNKIWNE